MKKAVIITSIFEVDNNYPLTYGTSRSYFTAEDRLRQTTFSVASLDGIRDNGIDIFIIDGSINIDIYRDFFKYQKNLKFISVKEEFPEILATVRSGGNTGQCEALMLIKFIEKYKSVLENYDIIFKLSGRYFIDSTFDIKIFNDDSISKIYFKTHDSIPWSDEWSKSFKILDRREIQQNNNLHQYSTVLFGWGKEYLNIMLEIFKRLAAFTGSDEGQYFSMETLMYFYTRPYEKDIIETNWTIYGWAGTGGNFIRY